MHGRVPVGVNGFTDKSTAGRILHALQDQPGLNIQELADEAGVTRTAANYAVRKLVKEDLIAKVAQGRHVLHFPATMNPLQRTALCMLRVESIRLVLEEAYERPDFDWDEVADRYGVSSRTVRRAVKRLVSTDLARHERLRNGRHAIHLHPQLRVLLARWKAPGGRPPLPNLPRGRIREWLWALPELIRAAISPW